LLGTLGLPAPARADRAPNRRERAGIERTARRHFGEPGSKVKVSEIKVSIVNRSWAIAAVVIEYPTSGDSFQVEFHRRHNGSWTVVYNLPPAVEADLGLDRPAHAGGSGTGTGTYVILGVIALLVIVGISTLLGKLGASGGGGGGQQGAPQGPAPRRYPQPPPGAAEKDCPNCGGTGKKPCPRCWGRKMVPNPSPPPNEVICPTCGARGELTDAVCNGTGKVRA
jgi:hypothetical protein